MIPDTDDSLRLLSQRLMTQLLPDLKSEFNLSDGMLIGLLMNAIADEIAYGIDRRMKDITDMKILLEKGSNFHDSGDATSAEPANLELQSINDLHDNLTRHLIKLQGFVEEQSSEEAIELGKQIWKYLETTAGRHAITAAG